MISTYKIERYEISQDRERVGIACFEIEDRKKLRLLIIGHTIIPTPDNEIHHADSDKEYATLNIPITRIMEFVNTLRSERRSYVLIDNDSKKILLSTKRKLDDNLQKSLSYYS